ncbi:MAG: GDP-L-fucose synthase [Pseudomonadota bacterium]
MSNPAPVFDLSGKRVWVAGHRGMVGSACVRRLAAEPVGDMITAGRDVVDLMDQARVAAFMADTRPDVVIVAAAKVGGILANDTYPADFLYDNLMIQSNIIHQAAALGTEKLMFLGSSCIYPKEADQPIQESALLTGPLEPTNEWYAIAKIAGIKLCQAYRKQHGLDFVSAMPTNLYGPNDNFDLNKSHVLPALIRKAHEAKVAGETGMEIWGTGTPRREFLHVDDLADALVHVLTHYSGDEHINVGSGEDVTIKALAETVMDVVGLEGVLRHDLDKPDGALRKLMAADKLRGLGWAPKIGLRDGIATTYDWFLQSDWNRPAA